MLQFAQLSKQLADQRLVRRSICQILTLLRIVQQIEQANDLGLRVEDQPVGACAEAPLQLQVAAVKR